MVLIMHLSWEYPPLVYGGLGRHVHALAEEQAKQGHDVYVVTQTEKKASLDEVNGVTIVRTPRDLPLITFDAEHLLGWVAGLEHSLTRSLVNLSERVTPDIIHAHDWMVAHTAITARALMKRPIVTTFHATEAGRHQGWLPDELSVAVHSVEWWLAQNSTRSIACSEHMRWEIGRLFDVASAEVDVIPNGIHLSQWTTDDESIQLAHGEYRRGGPLIVYSGRLEWEKGIHILLEALVKLRKQHPRARLVVAGRGGRAEELRKHAKRLKLGNAALFPGWLPESELHGLVGVADVAVVPSLYEPFGLVALEAAALQTPVVVADTGGLTEFADGDRVALTFDRGDATSLAETIAEALEDEEAARRRIEAANDALATRYSWAQIVTDTVNTYAQAIGQDSGFDLPGVDFRKPPSENLLESEEAEAPGASETAHATGRPHV